MSRSRLVLVLIATVVVSMFVGGAAVAMSTPQKVSACTGKKGAVRVLGTTVKCQKGEKKLTWRIAGKAGPRGPKGDKGTTGATGRAGPQGLRGIAGPAGPVGRVQNVRTVTATADLTPAPGVRAVSAMCGAGEQAIGGGFSFTNETQLGPVQESRPVVDPSGLQGWYVKVKVSDAADNVKAWAMCVAT